MGEISLVVEFGARYGVAYRGLQVTPMGKDEHMPSPLTKLLN